MPKMRIYELSKELNLKNSDIVEYLQSKNVDVKSHSSSIDDNAIDMVKKHFGKGTTVQNTEAPKEIKEQPARMSRQQSRRLLLQHLRRKMSR